MQKINAFSLMEMMVVLLIISIVTAASAPMINKKVIRATTEKTPWVWVGNDKSIAYNLSGANQTVSLGVPNPPDLAARARLYIDSKNNVPQLSLGASNSSIISLLAGGSSIFLSDNLDNFNAKQSQTVIGYGAKVGRAANHSIALGSSANANQDYSTAIGIRASAQAKYSTAIGLNSTANVASTTAIGFNSHATAKNALAIGYKSTANGTDSIALGYNSAAPSASAMAMGFNTQAKAQNSLAIGYNAATSGTDSIALGYNTIAAQGGTSLGYKSLSGQSSVALGYNSTAANNSIAIGYSSLSGNGDIAIGYGAVALKSDGIALGKGANAAHANSVAIGTFAQTTAGNQIVIGTKNDTVYIPGNLIVGKSSYLGADDASAISAFRVRNGDRSSLDVITGGSTMKLDNYYKSSSGMVSASGPGWDYYKSSSGMVSAYGPGWDYYKSSSGMVSFSGKANIPISLDGNGDIGLVLGGLSTEEVSSIPKNGIISDKRLKNIGKIFTGGLEQVRKLEVFNYTFKKDPNKIPRVGVMAQDLQKIFPNAVVQGDDGFLRIRMEDMFYALINAVKENDRRITALEKENKKLKKENETLIKQQEDILKRLSKIEKSVK